MSPAQALEHLRRHRAAPNTKAMERIYEAATAPPVRGILHAPGAAPRGAAVLAHGAGSNARAPLLAAVSAALASLGFYVLRCDLPYRQKGVAGPPRPGEAAADRDGLRRAAEEMKKLSGGPLLLGGHSYGGRQASMLAAEDPAVADALLLLSYPLHPPRRPDQLRTAHFAELRLPALFVHGTRDPFGSIGEMRAALATAPRAELLAVEAAGHELARLDYAEAARRAAALLQPAAP